MLRVATDALRPGMELARSVPNPNRPHDNLLQQGCSLTAKIINRLQGMGIADVWVRHGALSFLDGMVDDAADIGYRDIYATVRRQFESLQNRHVAKLDYLEYHDQVRALFDSLMSNPSVMTGCATILRQGDHLFTHAANVCYLCLVMGMKLESYLIEQRAVLDWKTARDVTHLGIGALLHDIGMVEIDKDVREKPEPLTPEETALVQSHTTIGFDKVRDTFRAPQANVVLHHHQRFDGTGYPALTDSRTGERKPPLAGQAIPIFSRICAICDVYDAATTSRPWRSAKLPIEAIREIKTDCAGWFDPVVLAAFLEVMPACPPGSDVELSDGRRGAVIEHLPEAPCRPVVKVLYDAEGTELPIEECQTVALTDGENSHLHIKTLVGRNVEELLFD